MLLLKDIKKDYQTGSETVNALKGVSIAFRKSEFVSILGQSGCGKTTLLNIVGGLDQYTSGDLVINGTSTKNYKDRDWDTYRNHSIGFVFQSYNLITHQTVLANVELALTLSGVSKEERRKRAIEALERVGLGNQLRKRPTQMSGGQMQRVAIARALVNNPDILLADEPTGALDSATSVQIMDILKEIAKDKLVVMVTHNGDLAAEYSTRIISLHDGLVVNDTNPYSEEDLLVDEENEKEIHLIIKQDTQEEDVPETLVSPKKKTKKTKKAKTSMSFFTALALSFNNLMTKKGRTILTAFAGSIGIIGISLILSLSNGINTYINQVQEETVSSYPITLESSTTDLSKMMEGLGNKDDEIVHPLDKVYSNVSIYKLFNSLTQIGNVKNDLHSFKNYLEENQTVHSEYIASVQYAYKLPLKIVSQEKQTGKLTSANPSQVLEDMMDLFGMESGTPDSTGSGQGFMGMGQVFTEIIPPRNPGEGYINEIIYNQYDLVDGDWPNAANEIILILDENNEIDDMTLYALGLKDAAEFDAIIKNWLTGTPIDVPQTSYTYKEIREKNNFRLVLPTAYYEKVNGSWVDNTKNTAKLKEIYENGEGMNLVISGIIRPKDGVTATALSGTVGYTTALTEWYINEINKQQIVIDQKAKPTIDIISGLPFKDSVAFTAEEKREMTTTYINSLPADQQLELYKAIYSYVSESEFEIVYANEFGGKSNQQITELLPAVMMKYAVEIKMEDYGSIYSTLTTGTPEEFKQVFKPHLIKALSKQKLVGVEDEDIINQVKDDIANSSDSEIEFIFDTFIPGVSESSYKENMLLLGSVDIDNPEKIYIYADDFEGKEKINEMINNYNNTVEPEKRISYTDFVDLVMGGISTIIDAISYVLIGFVSVSLIVSSIMIGIITYISVLERTKEIGILRAIGASKKDIARVFRAETIIEGFASGLLGILTTLLLCIPINAILYNLSGILGLKARLPFLAAIILILISVLLTLIAGMLPSRVAAKKDPVEALRTE